MACACRKDSNAASMITFTKITHNIHRLLPGIARICSRDKGIAALYLFGSHAKVTAGPLSDVDLAVLFEKNNRPKTYFAKRLHLISAFSRTLHTNEVELIVLNNAPVSLSYQVVKDGELLYERDRIQRIAFEAKTVSAYLDSRFLREIGRRYLKKRIAEGRYLD